MSAPPPLSDAELVCAYLDGDQAALGALWTRHERFVRALAVQLLGRDYRVADDVTQDVAVKLVRSVHTWAGRAAFRSWLYTVTASVVASHHRARRARPTTDVLDLADPALARLLAVDDTALCAVDDRAQLAQLLEVLPPCHVPVVLAVHVADQPVAQVAAALGVPVGTVKSRSSRGMAALRQRAGRGA